MACRALYEAKAPFKAFLQAAMSEQVQNVLQEPKKIAAPTVDTFYAGVEYDDDPTMIVAAKRPAESPAAKGATKRTRA